MHTPRQIALLAALLLLACLHTAHAQTAPEDSVRLVVQLGHTGFVNTVAFSPDGRTVLSGSDDETLKLWDVTSGQEIHTYRGHTDGVNTVVFSPDGRTALSENHKDYIKLWDVATGQELRTLNDDWSDVSSVVFSPDGRTALSGSRISEKEVILKLWDVATGQVLRTFAGHLGWVSSLAFSPDGRLALSGSYDNTLKLWDVSTGQELQTFESHSEKVTSVAFSPDGRLALSGSHDNMIIVWDVATGRALRTLTGHQSYVNSVTFSPDGKTALSCSWDETLKLWDVATGRELRTLEGHSNNVTSVAFSPDGKTAISGSWDKTLKLWDLTTGAALRTFGGSVFSVQTVAFSPTNLWFSSNNLKTLKLWDLALGYLRFAFNGHEDDITDVSFSPDGERLLSGSRDGTLILWDASTNRKIQTFSGHSSFVNSIDFSPDGRTALSGSFNGILKLWDLSSGTTLRTFGSESTFWVNSVAFSPDGRTALSGGRNTIKLWDYNKGKIIEKFKDHADYEWVNSVAFSPDGRTVLSGGVSLKLSDLATGRTLKRFYGDVGNNVRSVAFSPDGLWVLSGGTEKTLRLWDVATGVELRTFNGHMETVTAVGFSSDGKNVLSGSEDGTTRLWDIAKGIEIVSLIALGDSTDYIARTPDGYYKTTKGGLQAVHYVKGLTVYPFENFDLKYNRPDIVLSRIGLAPQELIDAYYRAYKKRLDKMGFKEEDLSGELHLPDVRLLNDELPYQTDQGAFRLPFTATDTKFTLDRINVFINDVPIYGTGGISLRGKDLSTLEQTLDLQLSAGENKIQVSVLNSAGVESLKESHYVTYTPATPTKPTLYVLSIGVSQYRQSQYNLTYAAKDAHDIAEYFRQNPGTYQEVKELVLTDADATTENILAARQFLAQAGVDDQVLVFVAGHGLLDGEYNYYFGAHGIDFLNPQAGGLPYEDLEGLLDGLPCRKKLLLMDTCHSGEADEDDLGIAAASDSSLPSGEVVFRNAGPGATKKEGQLGLKNSFELMNELFTDLRRGSGAHVISSAGGGEFALEGSEWQNGVFTYALLSGLKSGAADANQDGTITVSEIRSYVGQQVETLTRGAQRPTARQENLEYDFVVR